MELVLELVVDVVMELVVDVVIELVVCPPYVGRHTYNI